MTNKLFLSAMTMSLLVPAMVAPMPTEAKVEEVSFTDVPKGDKELPYALYELAELGVVNGYQDGTFRPNEGVTRGQVSAFIDRVLKLEGKIKGKTFKDVGENNRFYQQISRVQQAGIIDGFNDGTFRPNEPLTRAQMAKILSIAFDLPKGEEANFPDVPKNHWSKPYVDALATKEITVGSEGLYKPNETVTRGQYVMFLHRALNWAQKENQDVVKDGVVVTPKPSVKPKPETKPVPEAEPEKEQTPIQKPKPEQKYPIPVGKDLNPPKGWTVDTVKQYEKTILEEMLKKSQGAAGTGSYGSLKYPSSVERFLESVPARVKYLNEYKNIDWTEEEFLRIVREVMENGTLYIHPSNELALYYNYQDGILYRAVATFND